ncbi:hypothetical protein LUZ60_014808 [Juncus effusus]|nr:hypothetical protein LUZ60_014808 [Juncus effusus]
MEQIEHSYLEIRGLKLHIAHTGKGELGTVLFVHGFPEIWYSWRHQMVAVANAGFRAIALDCRGYGLSDTPSDLKSLSWDDLTEDLLAILDSLSISKVFIVAKDFGVRPAFDIALYHRDRVLGVVTIGVPPIAYRLNLGGLPKGVYIYRWREPGRAEADFGRYDIKRVIRTIYILFSKSEIPTAQEGQEIMDLAYSSTPLPNWFTEQDLSVYADLYAKSGLPSALQIPYRTETKEPRAENPRFDVPMFLIMGQKDYILKIPGLVEYISSGTVKKFAPDLDISYVSEGSHFVQEQFPEQVNALLIDFLKKHI